MRFDGDQKNKWKILNITPKNKQTVVEKMGFCLSGVAKFFEKLGGELWNEQKSCEKTKEGAIGAEGSDKREG